MHTRMYVQIEEVFEHPNLTMETFAPSDRPAAWLGLVWSGPMEIVVVVYVRRYPQRAGR